VSGLRGTPISIISGLALGIDAVVHEAALKENIHTMSLPGSGLTAGVLYPRAHVQLAKRIVEAGGALLSEWESQSAAPWTFPVRNQLMAKIADIVLIIEADIDSGTMLTARAAQKSGVTLAAIPGNIDSLLSRGPNLLIKEGAHCITSSLDIMKLLGITSERSVAHTHTLDHPILEHLTTPLHRDILASRMCIPSHELSSMISLLEIEGVLTISADGYVHKNSQHLP
jgi:DNA processing protein